MLYCYLQTVPQRMCPTKNTFSLSVSLSVSTSLYCILTFSLVLEPHRFHTFQLCNFKVGLNLFQAPHPICFGYKVCLMNKLWFLMRTEQCVVFMLFILYILAIIPSQSPPESGPVTLPAMLINIAPNNDRSRKIHTTF
jgi:hypothetical protein